MKPTFQPLNRRRFIRGSATLGLLLGLLWASGLRGQSPDEHASHHPGQAGGAMPAGGAGAAPGGAGGMGAMSAAGGSPAPGGMGGGMMEGMGEMMKNMGAPKPKDFYPSLMDLPDLPLAKRLEVEQQAGERMHSGVAMMNESLDHLLQAASAQNYAEMQAGTASLREGLAHFESGLAAQRALAEGKAPRNVALTWFKRDMNLLPLPDSEPRTLLGVTPFHLFTMVLLVAFALAMVAMYFFKMRRAAALFGRIEAEKKSPPPGSAPELAGGKPPDGKKNRRATNPMLLRTRLLPLTNPLLLTSPLPLSTNLPPLPINRLLLRTSLLLRTNRRPPTSHRLVTSLLPPPTNRLPLRSRLLLLLTSLPPMTINLPPLPTNLSLRLKNLLP